MERGHNTFKMADPPEYSWDISAFIRRTPCARESLISGICGGFGLGAVYFLRSKHVRRSCDVTVGSLVIVSFLTWQFCRYRRFAQQKKVKETVEMLNAHSVAHKREQVEPTEV